MTYYGSAAIRLRPLTAPNGSATLTRFGARARPAFPQECDGEAAATIQTGQGKGRAFGYWHDEPSSEPPGILATSAGLLYVGLLSLLYF